MPIGAHHVPVVKYASVETLYSYIIYPLHVVKSDIEFDSAISSFVYAKGTIVTVLISEFEINMVVAISVIFAGRYTVYLIDLYHIRIYRNLIIIAVDIDYNITRSPGTPIVPTIIAVIVCANCDCVSLVIPSFGVGAKAADDNGQNG